MLQAVLSAPSRRGLYSPVDFGAVADGSSHPARARGFATLAALQAVYPFATALSNEMDWLGIEAAKRTAETSGFGGVIDLGPGTYVLDQVISPFKSDEFQGQAIAGCGVSLKGAGSAATRISFPNDMTGPAGSQYVISIADRLTADTGSHGFWTGFSLIGPLRKATYVLAPGAPSPVRISAVGWYSSRIMQDVRVIGGFYAGFGICGDQSRISDCEADFCYYGWYWDILNQSLGIGDLLFEKVISSNFYVAGLACSHDAQIAKVHFNRCAFAQAPLCVMKETNGGSPASPVLFYECVFDATQFENPGLSAIGEDRILTSNDRVTVIVNSELRLCQFGPWTSSAAPAGTNPTAMIDIQSVAGRLVLDGVMEQLSWMPGQSGMIRIAGQEQLVINGQIDDLIRNCNSAVLPNVAIFKTNNPTPVQITSLNWSGEGAYCAFAADAGAKIGSFIVYNSNGTSSGSNPTTSLGNLNDCPLGVLMQLDDRSAGGYNGIIATRGSVTVRTSGATLSAGNLVRTGAGGTVTFASGGTGTTSPIVGVVVGSVDTTSQTAVIRLGGSFA